MLSYSPSDPVSSTGTGSLIPLPSRERGFGCIVLIVLPTLWFPAYAGMTERPGSVILALRQYPQGGDDNNPKHPPKISFNYYVFTAFFGIFIMLSIDICTKMAFERASS